MGSWVGFQILKNITNDKNLIQGVVLPGAISTKLSTYCTSIRLLDSRNREYEVEIDEAGDERFYNLHSGQWPLFYRRAIRIDPEINMLCFRLVGPDMFKVMCFRRTDGMEVEFDSTTQLLVEPTLSKRCLVKGCGSTFDRMFLPETFLRFVQKPEAYCQLFGSNQNVKVDVLYHPRVGTEKEKACGFVGPQWTLFCLENNIDEESTMLFKRFKCNRFYVDVFNSQGVGIGITVDPGTEEQVDNDIYQSMSSGCQVHDLEWVDDDSGYEDLLNKVDHRCRINFHEHTVELPSFLIKLQSHSFSSKTLTFPKSFVKEHQLHKYNTTLLNYGELHFVTSLVIKKDRRNKDDLTHLVCVYDWESFVEETGVLVGEFLRFEMEWKEDGGEKVYFNLC